MTDSPADTAGLIAHLAALREAGTLDDVEFQRLTRALLASVIDDVAAAASTAHWEYQEFSAPIGDASGPPMFGTTPGSVHLHAGPPNDGMHEVIERAVRDLLNEVGPQGWVPAEPTDAVHLWENRRVDYTFREPAGSKWLGIGKDEWTLRAVRVNFRRRAP